MATPTPPGGRDLQQGLLRMRGFFLGGNRLNQRGKAPEGRGVVLEGRLALRVISFCMEFTCAVIGSNEYSYKNTQSQVSHRIWKNRSLKAWTAKMSR